MESKANLQIQLNSIGSSGKDKTINISTEVDDCSEVKTNDNDEMYKKIKVQDQIFNHLKTGILSKDSIITPIMSNDGQIRQYILNDPISNPDSNEQEVSLMPGNKITNTTVDKSK